MTGNSPNGPFYDDSGATNPKQYSFAQVTTAKSGISSYLAGVLGIASNAAKAVAVAGRYHIDIMPIAICALDVPNCPSTIAGGTCGFQVGKTYAVSQVNPIGPGTFFWIDPETSGPGCNGCKYTSADAFRPYLCSGKSGPAITGLVGSTVCTNTGNATGPSFSAIDSRFGDYAPTGQCDPGIGPPDTNVKEYQCIYDKTTGNCSKSGNGSADWMAPLTGIVNDAGQAFSQSATVTHTGSGYTVTSDGVVWSFTRPIGSFATTRGINAKYPSTGTPYQQSAVGDPYFEAPPTTVNGKLVVPQPNRRVMNMLILQCTAPGGNCRDASVLGIGQFFLQKRTNTDNEIYAEFGSMVDVSKFTSEIKLYR